MGQRAPAGGWDGTGTYILTILGSAFTSTPSAAITGGFKAYTCTNAAGTDDSTVLCQNLVIDVQDVNKTLNVVVTTTVGASNGYPIMFSTSGSDDIGDAFKLLGMSLMTAIVVFVVVGILLLVGVILCTLSCCCGVSLAFLRCCCPPKQQPTLLISPNDNTQRYQSMA